MNSDANTITSNINRIPPDLHPAIFALLARASKLSQIEDLLGVGTSSTPAVDVGKAHRGTAAPVAARTRPPSMPKAKKIYVTAPAHLQESNPDLIAGTIRALKRDYPKAEFIDAGSLWKSFPDRGEAWRAKAHEAIGSSDLIVVVTCEDGFVGMGITNEIDMAKAASKQVVVVRSPDKLIYFVYPEFEVKIFKGAGSKSVVPAEIRNRVNSRVEVNRDKTLDIIQDVSVDASA